MNQILADIGVKQWIMRKSLPGAKQMPSCHRYEISRDEQQIGLWQVSGFLSADAEKLMCAMMKAIHATIRRTTAVERSSTAFVIICYSDDTVNSMSPEESGAIELPHPEHLLQHPSAKADAWKKLLALGVSS